MPIAVFPAKTPLLAISNCSSRQPIHYNQEQESSHIAPLLYPPIHQRAPEAIVKH